MDFYVSGRGEEEEKSSIKCPQVVWFIPSILLAIFTLIALGAVIFVPIEVASKWSTTHTGNKGIKIYPTTKGITINGTTPATGYMYYRYDHLEKSGDSMVTVCLDTSSHHHSGYIIPDAVAYMKLGKTLPTNETFDKKTSWKECNEITICIAESMYIAITSTTGKPENYTLTCKRTENDAAHCHSKSDFSGTLIVVGAIVVTLVIFLCLLAATLISICVICTKTQNKFARQALYDGTNAYANATLATT